MSNKRPLVLDDEGQMERLQSGDKLEEVEKEDEDIKELLAILILELHEMGLKIENKKLLNLLKYL